MAYEQATLNDLCDGITAINESIARLDEVHAKAEAIADGQLQANCYAHEVAPVMADLRAAVDAMEEIVAADYWPVPTFDDILFYVVRSLLYSSALSPSSSGLGRHPFKVDITGSNPVGGTIAVSGPARLRAGWGPFARRGPGMEAKRVARAGVMTALLAVSAQVMLPFGPVPFTLQTLVLAMVPAVLDPATSVFTVLAYVVLGAVGLPVFRGLQRRHRRARRSDGRVFVGLCPGLRVGGRAGKSA